MSDLRKLAMLEGISGLKEIVNDIIDSRNQIKQLEIKGKVLFRMLKEHEATVRLRINACQSVTEKTIEALYLIAVKTKNSAHRAEAVRQLTIFAGEAIRELGMMQERDMLSLPPTVTKRQLQEYKGDY